MLYIMRHGKTDWNEQHKLQGRTDIPLNDDGIKMAEAAARKLIDDAKAVEEAGAFALVLECVPAKLAKIISEQLTIPTIGIGAGAGCDGQILVYQDMLGMFTDFKPKFVKHFANVGEIMTEAFKTFDQEVKEGVFPAPEHTYKIDEDIIGRLY